MYPHSIYMGLKVLPIWVHWAQSIYYLGTWTLRDQGDGAANAMKFMASAQHTEPTQNAEPRDLELQKEQISILTRVAVSGTGFGM